MIHTMLSEIRLAGLLMVFVVLAGCGRASYHQQDIGVNSGEAAEVMSVVEQIRERGDAGVKQSVDDFGACDMPISRKAALRSLFKDIAAADDVELIALDSFGEEVYRASFRLQTASDSKVIHVLLVEIGGRLHWAGMN